MFSALQEAGSREIGGVLMGEHLSEGEFRIADLTVQGQSGGLAFFLRTMSEAAASLRRFFKSTGNNYRRFNYLGEWHSHPSFVPTPSLKDMQSMLEIVTDKEVGANFVVLLIVRLQNALTLESTATVFFPNGTYFSCEIVKEGSLER